MLRVALTGGIATGKSYCLRQFERLGARRHRRRRRSRARRSRKDTPGLRAIVTPLRPGTSLSPDGTLDRAALGRIVFADSRARGDLEAIVHPEVYQRIREWLANLASGTRVAIADIPLLFETGHHHDFDRVVVAACAPQEQIRRMVGAQRAERSRGARAAGRAVADRGKDRARGLRHSHG